jgi:crotonobetainyl-CoA:carnitine CoA-transferase CaiB-like acyl-CoA transferase
MQPQLATLRVLVHADRIATLYAGKVLADLGAKVTRVDLIGQQAPVPTEAPQGLYRAFLQASWRSLSMNGDHRSAADVLGRIVDSMDIVLIDGDGAPGPLYEVYEAERRAAVVRVSNYGEPSFSVPANEFTLQAEGGIMTTHDGGVAGPVGTQVGIGEFTAGVTAAIAALIGALRLQAGTSAPTADVSVLEALWSLMPYPGMNQQIEASIPFMNPFRVVPSVEPAADGLVCIVALSPPQWRALLKLTGDDRLADPRFALPPGRLDNRAEVEKYLHEFTAAHTVEELVEMGVENGLPIARVARIDEVPGMPPYLARDSFTRANGAVVPTNPFRVIGRARDLSVGPSPDPGAGADLTLAEAGLADSEISALRLETVLG